ncbi:PREDICTED: DNA polymerase beta isoform X2 [Tarenaya hassleriana]|uniref:DNA polymerase beta isoform X2 n=1 Tax=Tarenaya hassleriana TaxID=28532 RepID=UPI00053CA4B7|nr:PREDICTED: DNA polymerase beta isoform X2 [Tarenaya hassleriana]
MAPKRGRNRSSSPGPNGMFAGMVVFMVENGVQRRRLQIWKQKLVQMGAVIEEDRLTKSVTHVFAMNSNVLVEKLGKDLLSRFKGHLLLYQWLEDSLSAGEKANEDLYALTIDSDETEKSDKSPAEIGAGEEQPSAQKRNRSSPDSHEGFIASEIHKNATKDSSRESPDLPTSAGSPSPSASSGEGNAEDSVTPHSEVRLNNSTSVYKPPDLNRNITEIFGKLINIYRALGDDRRSFSYYKAIPVIEKLPFKIESVDQFKHLPGIGKSMRDHIQEIVTTGKLSKLEHFETDDKVRTISLFGEVWGIGPATALKLYEKGHRTLDDLKNEESLTHAQRLGLKYFDDIKTRIPRNEVQEMEQLLQRVGEEILPGVVIVCGGSYRRGKATCGDLDIVITHPDGQSHKGFLTKFVKHLKETKFLREDLIFSTHSEEGTDSGVDTYFGLCTYPGRELRHRIDLKVYPRDIYAFGLIAWTGNDVLNRRLRLLSESKGFRLDDTGLFPTTRSSGRKRGEKAMASLRFETEKEVFEFLGFPWLEPHERNL